MTQARSERAVTPKKGWAGIAAALKKAKSGDVVSIGAGKYHGQDTLSVPAGVTLRGEEDAKLIYTGDAVAILLENADEARVEGIEIHGYTGLEDKPETGDPDGIEVIGLIQILYGRGVKVSECKIIASAKRHSCIAAVHSNETSICGNQVSGARRGIAFWSTDGEIEGNRADHCQKSGINLEAWKECPDVPSGAKIHFNHCGENGESGVAIHNHCHNAPTSSPIDILSNECHHNGFSGIHVCSSNTKLIEDNKCYHNRVSGIHLGKSGNSEAISLGNARGNQCYRNEGSGIAVHNHSAIIPENDELKIEMNLCYENSQSGIEICSSTLKYASMNRCFDNFHTGILLKRDINSRNISNESKVNLIKNQVHHNKISGILIHSGVSQEISKNRIFANDYAGVHLQRCESSNNFPSSARIIGNDIHNNGGGGIALLSSKSESIEGNRIWSNKKHGVILQHGALNGANEPSMGEVRINYFQANLDSGVAVYDSIATVEENEFRDNAIKPIRWYDEQSIEVEAYPYIGNGNRNDASMDLQAKFLPNLRRAIGDSDLSDENGATLTWLASYLSDGCSGCFHRFWQGDEDLETWVMGDANRRAANGTSPLWSIEPALSVAEPLTMSKGSSETVAEIVTSRIGRWRRSAKTAPAQWLALISSDLTDSDSIAEKLKEQRQVESSGYVDGLKLDEIIKIPLLRGESLLRDKITAALMEGRSLAGEQMAAVARMLLLKWVLAGGMVLGGTGWLFGEAGRLTSALLAVVAFWNSVLPSGALGGVSLIALALLVIGLIDLGLPTHLRLIAREKGNDSFLYRADTSGILNFFGMNVLNLPRLLPIRWRTRLENWQARRWQLGKLFENGGAPVFILQDIDIWREGDVEWLQELIDNRPNGTMLINVLHIDGRMSLRPLLLDIDNAPWASGFEILLNDDEDRLRLGLDSLENEANSGELPGDFALLGAANEDDAKTLSSELGDEIWTVTDLLPTMPLASAPTARAELVRLQTGDVAQLGRLFDRDIPTAREFFVGRVDESVFISLQLIDRLFPSPGQAKALRIQDFRQGSQYFRSAEGRIAVRGRIGHMLRQVWPNDTDWAEYVASALRFGIWQRCNTAVEVLSEPGDVPFRSLRLARQLDAIRFLGEELERVMDFAPPLHGQDRYEEAWQTLTNAMSSASSIDDPELVVCRYFAAQSACARIENEIIEGLIDRITELVESHDEPKTGIFQYFCQLNAARIIELQKHELDAAKRYLASLRLWHWRGLPDMLIELFERLALDNPTGRRALSQQFAAAQSEAELEALVCIHADTAPRVVYALGYAAIRHITGSEGLDPTSEQGVARLAELSRSLLELANELGAAEKGSGVLDPDFGRGAAGHIHEAAFVTSFMCEEDASEKILKWLEAGKVSKFDRLEETLVHELELTKSQ